MVSSLGFRKQELKNSFDVKPRFILQVLKKCKLLELFIVLNTEDSRDDDDDSEILDDDSKIPASGELESWTGDYRVVVLNPVADEQADVWEIGAGGGQITGLMQKWIRMLDTRYSALL
jgi:hypothetical protein